MATGQERKQARADRYRKRALQAKTDSSAAYRRAEELVEHIPPGQPILVGHHSETKHRRHIKRHSGQNRQDNPHRSQSQTEKTCQDPENPQWILFVHIFYLRF